MMDSEEKLREVLRITVKELRRAIAQEEALMPVLERRLLPLLQAGQAMRNSIVNDSQHKGFFAFECFLTERKIRRGKK
jgi:hypothetical protein